MQFQPSYALLNPVEDDWSQAKKLDSLHPTFRTKVEAVMSDLRAKGYKPHIKFGWRSLETQKQLLSQGRTKVPFSFHNAVDINGLPAALAVDITDEADQWAYQNMAFFNAMGAAARKQGLVWGGDWVTFKDYAHIQGASNDALNLLKTKGLAAIGYISDSRVARVMAAAWLIGVVGVSGIAIALAWRYKDEIREMLP